jgi:hypothetical protein
MDRSRASASTYSSRARSPSLTRRSAPGRQSSSKCRPRASDRLTGLTGGWLCVVIILVRSAGQVGWCARGLCRTSTRLVRAGPFSSVSSLALLCACCPVLPAPGQPTMPGALAGPNWPLRCDLGHCASSWAPLVRAARLSQEAARHLAMECRRESQLAASLQSSWARLPAATCFLVLPVLCTSSHSPLQGTLSSLQPAVSALLVSSRQQSKPETLARAAHAAHALSASVSRSLHSHPQHKARLKPSRRHPKPRGGAVAYTRDSRLQKRGQVRKPSARVHVLEARDGQQDIRPCLVGLCGRGEVQCSARAGAPAGCAVAVRALVALCTSKMSQHD